MIFEQIAGGAILVLACSLALVTTVENNFSGIVTRPFEADYELPRLRYEPGDLEPYLSRSVVEAHHLGHHKIYTDNTNKLLRTWQNDEKAQRGTSNAPLSSKKPLIELFWNTSVIPEGIRQTFVNQVGGFVNHILYFECLSPPRDDTVQQPSATSRVGIDIARDFGNFSQFQAVFTQRAQSLFGSGYVWLVRDLMNERLSVITTANQETPFAIKLMPLLTLDVWEHAYYLQAKWKRADYITNWWRLVDWTVVNELDSAWRTLERDAPFQFLAGDTVEDVPLVSDNGAEL